MSTFIILVHVIVCIALILIVLLQTGKGSDMGAAFGGGASQTLFGSTGASSFLTKLTTGAAIVFMLTSLSLAYFSSRRPTTSVMSDVAPITQEAQQAQQAPAETPVQPETETTEPAAPEPAPEPAEKN
jgi:preprotein translocase subunit SecG